MLPVSALFRYKEICEGSDRGVCSFSMKALKEVWSKSVIA